MLLQVKPKALVAVVRVVMVLFMMMMLIAFLISSGYVDAIRLHGTPFHSTSSIKHILQIDGFELVQDP